MDIINNEKKYPQLVEIVNDPTKPNKVEITNLPFNQSGYLLVNVTGGAISLTSIRPSSATLYNVFLDNILLLQSDGTFVPIPLNSFFISLNQSHINSLLASYKTAYSTLVSGVTSATLHYSKQSSNGSVTSEVYNLKD